MNQYILSAMQGAVFSGGGDYPGNEFIIGSGPECIIVPLFFWTTKARPC